MFIKNLKGFKYPDMEIVRWFFKNKLDTLKNEKVLEFASHNGNNLNLFANYDYECLGVELSKEHYENAKYNFDGILKYKKFKFFNENMLDFAKNYKNLNAKVFLIPNVINFITKNELKTLLLNARKNHLYVYGGGGFFFFLFKGKKYQRSSL